jgi:predicted negative regulator of RcsB-dependent stress response
VDSVTWDSANSRYVVKLTGITYTHTTYVTLVTPVDSSYTATYASDSGNLVVYIRNSAGAKQKYQFSFAVLKAT